MANFIPIVKDLLPIIMPGDVTVTRAADLSDATGQTQGMRRQAAIVDQSDHLCSLVMTAPPRSSSTIHHHGAQDTIVYSVRGHGSLVSKTKPSSTLTSTDPTAEYELKKQDLHPGDWALIPAYAEHQEVNDSDEELVWVIVRSGRVPETVNLEGWGGAAVKDS